MKRKHFLLILGLVLLLHFSFGASIGLMSWQDAPEKEIKSWLGLASFEAPLVEAYQSSGRDRCELKIYQCQDKVILEAFKKLKGTKAFPLPKALYGLKDGLGLVSKANETEEYTFIPQISEGYYYFKDRTPKKAKGTLLNYTLICYDTKTDYLYYLLFNS